MEQLYLIEIFIDKVAIFFAESDEDSSGKSKGLITKVNFGPNVQLIIKEGQLVKTNQQDDVISCDEQGRRKFTRTVRVGKSFLFPSFPDTVVAILSKFPLAIEMWNDDKDEEDNNVFVGVGNMTWDPEFYYKLKECSEPNRIHEPLSIKQRTILWHECCCKPAAEVEFILRLTALGDSIITEFQQPVSEPDSFVFRTNKASSMFHCKRIEGDDPNFCMMGALYESTTLEDPDIIRNAQKKIEVCTELQYCGLEAQDTDYRCAHNREESNRDMREYAIDKIKMGEISGPCGNINCPLAHKVRAYIRNLDTYKAKAKDIKATNNTPKHVCGTCICKDDRHHREECPSNKPCESATCAGCDGGTKKDHTCSENDKKVKISDSGQASNVISQKSGSKASSKDDKSSEKSGKSDKNAKTVAYVFSVNNVPDFKETVFGRDYTCQSLNVTYNSYLTTGASRVKSDGRCCCRAVKVNSIDAKHLELNPYLKLGISSVKTGGQCCCRSIPRTKAVPDAELYTSVSTPTLGTPEYRWSTRSMGMNNQLVYNVHEIKSNNKYCMEITDDKDCKCSPQKPRPPCRTFDCDCLQETVNIASRKRHKPYCPLYKHKTACPVTTMFDDDENKKPEEEEDSVEPLPYGLPPIKLGPCPVMGRPCSVPDGFTRMYKNAAQPPPPPSHGELGKVCCSKEYERIKTAIKEYMKHEKDHDLRCVNVFNIDTERRCCDKEQILLALMGKSCCGTHKLSIREKFPENEKKK